MIPEKYSNGQHIENISHKPVTLAHAILLILSDNMLMTSESKCNFEKLLILPVNLVIINIFDLCLLPLMLAGFVSH